MDLSQTAEALQKIADESKEWAAPLRALLVESETSPIVCLIRALPIDHRWERIPSVTLLGDAAHLKSAFAGEGANLAIYDGAELAHAIRDHSQDLETALAMYEQALFSRSATFAARTAINHQNFFGSEAPASVGKYFSTLLF